MAFELGIGEMAGPTQPVVRCHKGEASVGDSITSAQSPSGSLLALNLRIVAIERYKGIEVETLDTAHVGRLTLDGPLDPRIGDLWLLRG